MKADRRHIFPKKALCDRRVKIKPLLLRKITGEKVWPTISSIIVPFLLNWRIFLYIVEIIYFYEILLLYGLREE